MIHQNWDVSKPSITYILLSLLLLLIIIIINIIIIVIIITICGGITIHELDQLF